MNEFKHTELPWSVVAEDLRGGKYYSIARQGLEPIDIHENENGEADAAFIVLAANSYYSLVKALEEADFIMKAIINRETVDPIALASGIHSSVVSALKLAKGGE